METTQTPNPPTFETVLADFQEIRQIMKESAERHDREMKELEQKTERSRVELNQKLGNYINLFGEVTEYEIAPKLREKFIEFGFDFQKTNREISVRDSTNNIFFEVDVILENGDTAMLVEIKTRLTVERIKSHITRIEKMRKYADLRGDKRTFLGAVAGVVAEDEARKYALDQGFYLIEPSGESFTITPPNGKPKEW